MISVLYASSGSSVLVNHQIGYPFLTTVNVRQGCLLFPVLFNIFLEKIIQDTLKHHDSTLFIGGRHISNYYFADDIAIIVSSSNELQILTYSVVKSASKYIIEISHE